MNIRIALILMSAGFVIVLGSTGCGTARQEARYSPHVTVTPSSGEGSAREFLVTISPAIDLKMAGLLINSTPDGSKACYTLIDVKQSKFFLVKDPGSGSVPFMLDSSGENSQCSVRVLSVRRDIERNLYQFRVAAQFKPVFAGGQSLFVLATNTAGRNWLQQAGSWMVAL